MVYVLAIKHRKRCFLQAKKAEPVPPLGTILGNLGLNTVKFCEEFNNYTQELPQYFILKTLINVFENRTYKMEIEGITVGFLLKLLKFEKKFKILVHGRFHEKTFSCIHWKDLIQLALFKFPGKNLEKSVYTILGSVKSMGLKLIV